MKTTLGTLFLLSLSMNAQENDTKEEHYQNNVTAFCILKFFN